MRSHRASRGVTRVEALAVGAAVLVAGVLGARLVTSSPGDELSRARTGATTVALAASTWRAEHPGECPTLSVLSRDRALPSSAQTSDPWGERFRVTCGAAGVRVLSAGPDRRQGTSDDVSGTAGEP